MSTRNKELGTRNKIIKLIKQHCLAAVGFMEQNNECCSVDGSLETILVGTAHG